MNIRNPNLQLLQIIIKVVILVFFKKSLKVWKIYFIELLLELLSIEIYSRANIWISIPIIINIIPTKIKKKWIVSNGIF